MSRPIGPGSRPQFVKYLGVGVINTLTGLSVTYLGKWWLELGDASANVVGYAVGLVVSYNLNRNWTFAHSGSRLRTLPLFLLVALVSYGANFGTVMLAIHYFGVNSYLAQALGIPPYTITSYLANKYFVFTSGRRLDSAQVSQPPDASSCHS